MRTTFLASLGAFYAVLCLSFVSAVPVGRVPEPTFSSPILGPQLPHFVAYSDESAFGIPNAKDLQGYNTLILSFLLVSGPADQADAWRQLSASQRAAFKADYKANNITLLVSAFGSTESPTTNGKDPTQLAKSMARFVKDFDLDGIDVDYEDFKAVSKGTALRWLQTFTKVLRQNLPDGEFILTHAPVAPWFGDGQLYAQVNTTIGHLIDWYNVQFYSQGTEYTSCATLIHRSGGDFPGTSLLEIVDAGVPQEKLVLGKPATAALVGGPVGGGDGETPVAGSGGTQVAGGEGTQVVGGGETQVANGNKQVTDKQRRDLWGRGGNVDPHINGFLETDTLAHCLVEAQKAGWNAGVMVWEFPDADKKWIQKVRSLAWPFHAGKR